MQTQIEKALNDIARELREIRKILEKDKKGPVTVTIDDNKITLNKPWQPIDCLSNNPEAHDWRITEDERSN